MPALPAIVDAYVDRLVDELSTAASAGFDLKLAPQNYLFARDLSAALELLQAGLSTPAPLTCVAALSTSLNVVVQTTTEPLVANTQVGNLAVFAADTTTAALRGESRLITSNTATALVMDSPLPAVPADGDTVSIVGAMAQPFIDSLRGEDKGIGDSPYGSVYGSYRDAIGALYTMFERLGGSVALFDQSIASLVAAVGSSASMLKIATSVPLRIDELRDYKVTVAGASRRVVSNDADSLLLDAPLGAAPAGGDAVAVSTFSSDVSGLSAPKIRTHPGAQPGENQRIAYQLGLLQATITAFALPESL